MIRFLFLGALVLSFSLNAFASEDSAYSLSFKCEKGQSFACLKLGSMYYSGKGTELNYSKSAEAL